MELSISRLSATFVVQVKIVFRILFELEINSKSIVMNRDEGIVCLRKINYDI